MINLPTKFEVPIFTCYGNMKGIAKCNKIGCFGVVRGHPRPLKIAPFDRAFTISYSSLIEAKLYVYLVYTVYEI